MRAKGGADVCAAMVSMQAITGRLVDLWYPNIIVDESQNQSIDRESIDVDYHLSGIRKWCPKKCQISGATKRQQIRNVETSSAISDAVPTMESVYPKPATRSMVRFWTVQLWGLPGVQE